MRERLSMPWFRRGDYDEIRRMMEGGSTWAPTYDEWLTGAEAEEKAIVDAGGFVERVMIEPYEFEVWCAAMGWPLNEASRLQFAAENASSLPVSPR